MNEEYIKRLIELSKEIQEYSVELLKVGTAKEITGERSLAELNAKISHLYGYISALELDPRRRIL